MGRSSMLHTSTILHAVAVAITVAVVVPARAQSTADVLERARPSVVTITTCDADGKQNGQGSGFFVRKDGVVMTAWHVVSDAASAVVKTQSSKSYPVKGLIAKDAGADYALLKVDIEDSPTLELGDSDLVRQGDRVLTLGSPLGLEGSASEGMVSAIRAVAGTMHLQLTAPVSHGSSGGPVLNLQGQVIGVTVFYIKDGQSLNFAVAINETKKSIDSAAALRELPQHMSQEDLEIRHLTASHLCGLARAAFLNDKQRAARLWEAAANKDHKLLGAYLNAGMAYGDIYDHSRAVNILTSAVTYFPKNAMALQYLGKEYVLLGAHNSEAVTALERSMKLMRGKHRDEYVWQAAAYYLILAYQRTARYGDALAIYAATASKSKPDSEECFSRGFCLEELGRHTDAEKLFALGMADAGGLEDGWGKLGDAWNRSADDGFNFGDKAFARAKSAYRRAINAAVKVGHSPALWYEGIAGVDRQLGEWREVVSDYAALIDLKQDAAFYHCQTGEVYLQLGDVVSAESEYKALLKMGKSGDDGYYGVESQARNLREKIDTHKVRTGELKLSGSTFLSVFLGSKLKPAELVVEVTIDGNLVASSRHGVAGEEAGPVPGVELISPFDDSLGVASCLDTKLLPDGQHKVLITVTDRSGVKVSSTTVNLIVNNSGGDADHTIQLEGIDVDADWVKP